MIKTLRLGRQSHDFKAKNLKRRPESPIGHHLFQRQLQKQTIITFEGNCLAGLR